MRQNGVTVQTYYRWRNENDGIGRDRLKRLKDLKTRILAARKPEHRADRPKTDHALTFIMGHPMGAFHWHRQLEHATQSDQFHLTCWKILNRLFVANKCRCEAREVSKAPQPPAQSCEIRIVTVLYRTLVPTGNFSYFR